MLSKDVTSRERRGFWPLTVQTAVSLLSLVYRVEYLFRVSARNRVGTGEPVETDSPVEARSKYGKKTFLSRL